MPPETIITVACRLEHLSVVAAEARRLAESAVGAEAAALVDLAITEVCSNVVRHGHSSEPQHEYTVHLRPQADAIEIEIRDVGPAFDVAEPMMPSVAVDLDDMPAGGFGLALVAMTMDEFEQWREGGVNITRVVKRRP